MVGPYRQPPPVEPPPWLKRNARLISYGCIALLVVTAVFQVVDIGDDESPWIPLALMYLSSAALGLDAVAKGVRKHVGEGISIRNLAPGGWTIFVAMFWIIAVPAYYFGARRHTTQDFPREPVTWGSWVSIVVFALFGVVLLAVGIAR